MKMNGRNNGIIVIGTEVVDFMLGKNINGYIMKEFKGSGSFAQYIRAKKTEKPMLLKYSISHMYFD